MAEYALGESDEETERLRAQARRGRELHRDLWPRAGVVPGARVADLGCGPAATLLGLADLVGPSGRLVGVDTSGATVARARADAAAAGVRNLEVVEAPASSSGLEPGSFDTVVIRHVLAHNGGGEQEIVDHAASLLRPGGSVFVFDIDMTMTRIRPPTAPVSELSETYQRFVRESGNDPSVGLRLGDLLSAAALEVVHFDGTCQVVRRGPGSRGPGWSARHAMVEAGTVTDDDIARWEREFAVLDGAAEQPRFFLCGFAAIGRRPTRAESAPPDRAVMNP